MKIFLLYSVLVVSKICVPTICGSHNASSKICYQSLENHKEYTIAIKDYFMSCEEGSYCNPSRGICTPYSKAGEWCVSYLDCASHYCIHHKCASR